MKPSWLAELGSFDPDVPVERALTPPATWYLGERFDALDRVAVLAPSWQPVARREQLAEPGSFAAGCAFGEPYVVTRDRAGVLHGLSNVCRHKAMQVATGIGSAERLSCRYHGWSYRLDGTLESAPKLAGIEAFDRQAMSLPRLGVCEWGHWVFVHADPAATPLSEAVSELGARLDATDWTQLRFVASQRFELACNWKVLVDNYLDGGYHVPTMHPGLDRQIDMSSYRTEIGDVFTIQSSSAGDGDDQRIGAGAVYAWLFPNFMINRYGPCLDSNWVLPLGPERCAVIYEYYFDDQLVSGGEAERARIERSMAQSARIQNEDTAICESVQIGLGSVHYQRGRYAPRLEHAAHHFHRLLHRAYRRALAPGP